MKNEASTRIPDVEDLSIQDIREGLKSGRFSCVEVVQVKTPSLLL